MNNQIICYIASIVFIINMSACSDKVVLSKNAPEKCHKILKEIDYRILPVNDSVFAFRFDYPLLETYDGEFNSKRISEYRSFANLVNNFPADSLMMCNIREKDLIKSLGVPSNITKIGEGNNFIYRKGKVYSYSFNFGFECDTKKLYYKNGCEGIVFYTDESGILYKIRCDNDGWGIEYIYEELLRKKVEEINKDAREKEVISEKEKLLRRVSSYIKRHDNNSYDFLNKIIDVPFNFDTITWTDHDGNRFRTSDTLKTKYLIYQKKLDSLVSYSLHKENITLEDIGDYFESAIHITLHSNGSTASMIYYFNKPDIPDCFDYEIVKWGKCSKLIFQFDENRILKGIDSTFFWP